MQNTLLIVVSLLSVHLSVFAGEPGYVIGWGDNRRGQVTGVAGWPFTNGDLMIVASQTSNTGAVVIANELLSNVIAVAADWSSYALKTDGTVVEWGRGVNRHSDNEPLYLQTNGPVIINDRVLSNVVAIVFGASYGLALKKDRTVATWGNNTVPAGLSNVAAISARDFTCTAVKSDGTVVGWGTASWDDKRYQLYAVSSLSNVVAIAMGSGDRHLALKEDGTLAFWGSFKSDLVSNDLPPGLSNVVAVAVGAVHRLALLKDGTVMDLSGYPVKIDGQILTNVVAITAADNSGYAVKRDGTVVGWAFEGNSRLPVPAGLSGVTAITIGRGFCLAITTNRAVADKFRQNQ